ncbi:MAG: GxxExxY protein [Armatimonadetes bacterium]|nr:GxxExxY protein [Armatimonadota bacterium]
MSEFLYKEETYRILGACFEVYKEKGCGFLEPVYQECLGIEFDIQGILYVPKKKLRLTYKGRPLEQTYEADFVCYDKIIVEIKAVSELVDQHRAQILNYLHATKMKVGLLVNFGHHPKVEHERFSISKKLAEMPAEHAEERRS